MVSAGLCRREEGGDTGGRVRPLRPTPRGHRPHPLTLPVPMIRSEYIIFKEIKTAQVYYLIVLKVMRFQ